MLDKSDYFLELLNHSSLHPTGLTAS